MVNPLTPAPLALNPGERGTRNVKGATLSQVSTRRGTFTGGKGTSNSTTIIHLISSHLIYSRVLSQASIAIITVNVDADSSSPSLSKMTRALQSSAKRKRPPAPDQDAQQHHSLLSSSSLFPSAHKSKKARHTLHYDLLSPLSDELLVRILSLLSLPDLLSISPVSRRFHALSADSQLWRHLYYARFVLPRALRIPGFRDGSAREGKLHYASRRNLLWADGRRGGWADAHPGATRLEGATNDGGGRGDWKRQYRLRHNWALGKCVVEELYIRQEVPHDGSAAAAPNDLVGHGPEEAAQQQWSQSGKTLVKVVDGVAITADFTTGLRAWDLRTKRLIAQTSLSSADPTQQPGAAAPSCIAIDDQRLQQEKTLDVAIGFTDGSFGVWRVGLDRHNIVRRYRHEMSSNGALVGLAYSHPYLLTATKSVLVSLYTFDVPETGTSSGRVHTGTHKAGPRDSDSETERESATEGHTEDEFERGDPRSRRFAAKDQHGRPETNPSPRQGVLLPPPYLLTSLKSHTSRDPLALSIRKSAGGTTVASIAYTFSTIQGWSMGIQDLHIRPPLPSNHHHAHTQSSSNKGGTTTTASPEVVTTRLAYTLPVRTAPRRGRRRTSGLAARRAARDDAGASPFPLPLLRPGTGAGTGSTSSGRDTFGAHSDEPIDDGEEEGEGDEEEGPTSICYTHPYLLATLPDNTLILHLCTSTSTSLSISSGIRLWGHTSGISDAEITARGKAVSVSQRGDEIRVWELEGRGGHSSAAGSGGGNGRRSDRVAVGNGNAPTGAMGGSAGFVPPAGSGGARRVVDSSSNGSIAVRPVVRIGDETAGGGYEAGADGESMTLALAGQEQWDDKRNWVGFDDEMVIVLKEAKDGRESLLVYDFT